MINSYVAIYYPSLTKDNEPIQARSDKLKTALKEFAKLFGGGATLTNGQGYWEPTDSLEDVTIIKSYTMTPDLNSLTEFAERLKAELNQDSIMIETNQGVDFI
jgi:hypothetical protein